VYWISWAKELLGGGRFVSSLWIWIGAIVAPFVCVGVFTRTTGLQNFKTCSTFLGLPDGFMKGVDNVESWMVYRSVLIQPVSAVVAGVALAVLFCGPQSRYVMPSGPAAATFYIAVTGGQIAGGVLFVRMVVTAVVIGAIWWFLRERRIGDESFWGRIGLVLAELCFQALYVLLVVGLAAFLPRVAEGWGVRVARTP